MKKLMVIVCAMLASEVLFAATTPTVKKVLTEEERRQRKIHRAGVRKARIEREGGLVVQKAPGKIVRFVNAQNKVSISAIKAAVESIENDARLACEIVSGEQGVRCYPDEKAGAVITILENADDPTILVAPENAWAVVNVGALARDGAAQEVLETRVRKEVWRAFAIALGASNSPFQPCLMHRVNTLADLDAGEMLSPSPFPINSIVSTARALKIGEHRAATYRRACQEGWAPAPTNDVQKEVWAAVKAEQSKEPTKGLKIQYDPKVGK